MMGLLIGGLVVAFFVYEIWAGTSQQTSGTDFATAVANAIAKAEGTSPLANNPGSLTAGDVPSGNITGTFNNAGVVIIDSIHNGWNFLISKIQNILNGNSSTYSPDMTISEFAQVYTGGDNADSWAATVAGELGVTPDITLAQAQEQYNGAGQ